MKYKCEMIRDLMPLCLDQTATEASEQAVTAHIAECRDCAGYYEMLGKEIAVEAGNTAPENKYIRLAAKIRKRNLAIRLFISSIIVLIWGLCVNYAAGYRLDPQKAADTSGRLNYKSQVIGSYEWNDWKFYFYDSYSCYDVVLVEKTWHGWGVTDTCLNWPKWFEDGDGIEMAGALCHWSDDKGIQLFPFIVRDSNVKTVEVTVFDETKTMEVVPNEFTLVTFEDSGEMGNDTARATAYDEAGNPLYTLETEKGYWVWKPAAQE